MRMERGRKRGKEDAQRCISSLINVAVNLDTIKTRPGSCFCCIIIFFCFCTFMGLLLSWRGKHPTWTESLFALPQRRLVRKRMAKGCWVVDCSAALP